MDREDARSSSPPPDREAMDDFDDVERITRAFVRWARTALVVGLPLWLLLLLVMPRTGLSPLAALSASTVLAGGVVVVAERVRRARIGRAAADAEVRPRGAPRARRPMSAGAAVLLTLAGVAAVVYVLFIVVTVIRG